MMVDADVARHTARGAMTRVSAHGRGRIRRTVDREGVDRARDTRDARGARIARRRAAACLTRRRARVLFDGCRATSARHEQIDAMLDAARPDVVIHLAGVAFPPDADANPARDLRRQRAGRGPAPRARSRRADARGGSTRRSSSSGPAQQYGCHDAEQMPLTESAEQRPLTAYAASKAAQEMAALQRFRADGLRVIVHAQLQSLRRGPDAAVSAAVARATRARRCARRRRARCRIGNDVDARLSCTFATSRARIWRSRSAARPARCTTCASGVGVSVRRLAADVLLQAGVAADITTEQALVRSTDIPVLVGSPAKLMGATGWAPRLTHTDIIDDLLRSAHAATD